MKKVVLAGGSGFIGKLLSNHFLSKGWQVVVFTRNHRLNENNLRYVKWNGKTLGSWKNELEGSDLLINLNGKSVDCRYTKKNKQLIYDTRIDATYILGEALKEIKNPPSLWINAASATIYRHSEDKAMDEFSGEIGTGFSVDVCKKWEHSFFKENTKNTRKVALRIAIVLGKKGGALEPMVMMTKLGLGGKHGKGNQFFSWIHEDDLISIVNYVFENDKIQGIVNASAPFPVKNKQVMQLIRQQLNIKIGISSPKWLLEIGARLIKTETELLLKSRNVIPRVLIKNGFEFKYPTLKEGLKSLL